MQLTVMLVHTMMDSAVHVVQHAFPLCQCSVLLLCVFDKTWCLQ